MRRTSLSSLTILATILLALAACQSAPEPMKDTQKLRSGSEIATSTGDQTRAALEKEPGLVLYASSIPEGEEAKENTQEPVEPKTPTKKPPVTTEPTPDAENSDDAGDSSDGDAPADKTPDASKDPADKPATKDADKKKEGANKKEAKPAPKDSKADAKAEATDL
jgi:hypothetical protein